MILTYNTIKDIYAWLTVDVKNRVLSTFTKFKQLFIQNRESNLLYNKKYERTIKLENVRNTTDFIKPTQSSGAVWPAVILNLRLQLTKRIH